MLEILLLKMLKYSYRTGGFTVMKRIKYACLEQTIHFRLKEDIGHDEAVRLVREEVKNYKEQLAGRHVRHQIVDEQEQADGSVLLMLKKQYNHHDCGSYIDN